MINREVGLNFGPLSSWQLNHKVPFKHWPLQVVDKGHMKIWIVITWDK